MAKKIQLTALDALVKRGRTKFEAVPYDRGGYFIDNLDGDISIASKADAEAIAEALNIAVAFRSIQRKADRLAAELGAFTVHN